HLSHFMNLPIVSIILPCYNQGTFLLESLNSLNKINYSNKEIIIVNDGSTENLTNYIISELDPEKYTIINQENQGLAMARNKGIEISNGEFIIPLDADNLLGEEFINKCIQIFLDNPEYD